MQKKLFATPMQAFNDKLPLAKEKMIAAE